MTRSPNGTILLTVVVTVAMSRISDAARYTITDLGTFNGTLVSGLAINNSGHVTGWTLGLGPSLFRAFSYVEDFRDLGTLGGRDSIAEDINTNTRIVGYSTLAGEFAQRAFSYDGTMRDLGTLGGKNSYAQAISDNGLIVGNSEFVMGSTATHAFLYDGAMHDLGTFGGSYSQGEDVNNSGQVTGSAWTTGDLGFHAFFYDGMLHDLGTLGGVKSYGIGINEKGHVVGASTTAGELAEHSFFYDGVKMHDIGNLGAKAINENDEVVGFANAASGDRTSGYIWTMDTGIIDLNTLIPPDSGYLILDARDINDRGQILAQSRRGDVIGTVILTPVPEPTALILATVAFLGRLTLRKSKSS